MNEIIDKILHDDCMDILPSIPDKFIDLILTDIPYNVVSRDSNGLRNLDKEFADIINFDLEEFMSEISRICSGSIYVFCATEQAGYIREFLSNKSFSTRTCVWEKTNPSPMNGQYIWLSGIELCIYGKRKGATFNEHCKNTVWRYPVVRGKKHPTEKNHDLFKYLIETSSNIGDIVLDPCNGSGVTTMMAHETGRHFIGIDIDLDSCNIARSRIS